MNPQNLLFIREIAKELRVSDDTIRRLVWSGQLVGHRIRGQVRISRADLADYLQRAREAGIAIPRKKQKNPRPRTALAR
jgi:excisionase family DNA binding protein